MKIVLAIEIELEHRDEALRALNLWGVPYNELGYPDGRVVVEEIYESEINKS